ncbi:putative redox protein, regulator of disulfide bond formation [Halalkaliarchaeum sp. AArc-CO]|uniref:OsmC family protein n=1 Tax=Halalkaliarchaeum sp. AArc-CO TaxID=2866381 RepID=UPI00217DC86B|nr:OsmC family protein [Halalkaliarchaeum sp. AArc-CO]UWG52164.1 putative redox protein, regulator of disulfide bond formation [Halalkaliarchaeum sp. AArc-CO]
MTTEDNSDSELSTKTVTGTRISPKRMTIDTGDSEFTIGSDGSPLHHLLGSYAACINSTGSQVARDWGMDIESLEVSVEASYDPRIYLGEDVDARAGFQGFDVTVDVEADADRETIEEWIAEIERRCPVSDNIENETEIAVTLSSDSA